jgi:hypothetical protein
VEGAPRPTRIHDSEDHALKVVEHFLCRDSHGHEAQPFQISISRCIPRRAIASVVRFAINLNRQAC